MMLREDYLLSKDLKVYQDPSQFCLNTDTALLAQFMKIHPGETVLDIGTNNAALLKAADQEAPAHLIGVEINESARPAAEKTAEGFKHPYTLLFRDIKTVQLPPVDVILCNPPYFPVPENRKTCPSAREMARFEITLSLSELCFHAARLLKSNGRLYLVHRPNRLNDLFQCLQENRFAVRRFAVAYDARDKEAKSVLIEAVLDAACDAVMEPAIWI